MVVLEIKLNSLHSTQLAADWFVMPVFPGLGTWSSLSQVNEGLALPSFLLANIFSDAWSEPRVKGVGNKLAETQFIHQDIIL